MKLVIGITWTEAHYQNYPLWIRQGDENIEVLTLTPENPESHTLCNGIVLSGGVDTHPKFYRNSNIQYPNAPTQFNEDRDVFELDIFRHAREKKIPVLAVCRGMQLVNIALGGDMIQDIEATGKKSHRRSGADDRLHPVVLAKDSLLGKIAGSENGTVNSAHHQAVDAIAPDLVATAWSNDGLVEGMEWKNSAGKSFLLGVQWHPERLGTILPANPLSEGVRKAFLDAVAASKSRLAPGMALS